MSLSDTQIKRIAQLTFREPYSLNQISTHIQASYREVYDFFRTKKGQSLFTVKRPWIETIEEADPKLTGGKKKFFNKLTKNPDTLVRLSPNGFYLITAGANLKPTNQNSKIPQQEGKNNFKIEKQIFRKLNYSAKILEALENEILKPEDLPRKNYPGSDNYYQIINNNLPAGWSLPEGMQNIDETHIYSNYEESQEVPIETDYTFDRACELYERSLYQKFEPFKLGKCGPERWEAVHKLIRAKVKRFGYTIPGQENPENRVFIKENEDIKDECVELFENYLERTKRECLVLLPKKDIWGEPVLLPNANRFNNEAKRMEARIRFENIFNDASRTYKNAIMLTLTSGQWHRNIFEDFKAFQENFNKLITRLRKEAKDSRVKDLVKKNPEFLRVKIPKHSITAKKEYPQQEQETDFTHFKRVKQECKTHNKEATELRKAAKEFIKSDNSLKLPYLCVREFQKNGNVHYHIIIFGIKWLKRNDEISRIWEEYGQGKITKINKIGWNEERGYIWGPGQAPEDSKGRQPLEYLKKYLLKGQYADRNPEAALLYWVFNSRFYTYSSSLLSDMHKPRPYKSKGLYEFAGVWEGGYWYQNGELSIFLDWSDNLLSNTGDT